MSNEFKGNFTVNHNYQARSRVDNIIKKKLPGMTSNNALKPKRNKVFPAKKKKKVHVKE